MHLEYARALFFAAWPASLVVGKTITIEGGDLYFKPSNVNASVGDVLEFHFLPENHSVVMGDFNHPCQPATTGGFYSGFLPAKSGENGTVFQVTINDTDPIVYYCSQNASSHNHCKGGMFGFVNQANQTQIDAYNTTAGNSSINISPDGDVFGGTLVVSNMTANGTSITNGTSTMTGNSSSATTSQGPSSTLSRPSTNTGPPVDNAVSSAAGLAAKGLVAVMIAAVMV